MKKYFVFFLLAGIFLLSNNIIAQDDSHIVVVTTWYVNAPEDGSVSEYDSLSAIVNEKIASKNSKIISRYQLRHLWGSDSRHVVIVTEYANMQDIDAAAEEGSKLFREAFPSADDRKEFNKAYSKYWDGYHSDEIYTIVTKK